jgi:hypothetical protein
MPPPKLPKLPSPNLPTKGTKIKHVVVVGNKNKACCGSVDSTPNYRDGGCSLTLTKVTNPNIIRQQLNHHVLHTHQIKAMYRRLGAKNRCPLKEANQISLIYVTSDQKVLIVVALFHEVVDLMISSYIR